MPDAPLGRVLTAMVSPMRPDGSLDFPAVEALADHLVQQGNDGLVVNGTTGESPTTTDDEKDDLVRAVVNAVGDRAIVIAGAGSNDTAHSVDLARRAEKAGAHALLVVTPYYNKPPQEGLLRHFAAVADGTGLPIMLYDIPGRSVVAIHTETLLRAAEHPRIVAVKDAKGDLAATAEVLAAGLLDVYSGEDALNLPMLAMGAVGVVSVVSHVATPLYAAMVDAVDSGDLASARRLNAAAVPAVRGLMSRAQGAVMAKAALQMQGVIPHDAVRLPLIAPDDALRDLLRTDLADAGLS